MRAVTLWLWWAGCDRSDDPIGSVDRPSPPIDEAVDPTSSDPSGFSPYDVRARRIVMFLNVATREVLTHEVGLAEPVAGALADGTFTELADVLRVPGVDAATIDTVWRFVDERGLYDDLPIWTALAPMIDPRYLHAMVTLPDGRLVVTGGYGEEGILASVEAFDPATGSWTALARMHHPRYDHDAVALTDGRILVWGGWGNGQSLPGVVELYDPATDTWAEVAHPSWNHPLDFTLTALPDGRALRVGATQLDVYDPATDTWTSRTLPYLDRRDHTTTALDDGRLVMIGGHDLLDRPLGSVSVFDPVTGITTIAANLVTSRFDHAAIAIGPDQILVVGGTSLGGEAITDAEIVDLAAGPRGRPVPGMSVGRAEPEIARLDDDRVVVVGGREPTSNGPQPTPTTEVFDLRTEQWGRAPDGLPRDGHTLAVADGVLFVIGGDGYPPASSVAAVILDPYLAPPTVNPTTLQWDQHVEADAQLAAWGETGLTLGHEPLAWDAVSEQLVAVIGRTGPGDFDFGRTLTWDGLQWRVVVEGAAMFGPPREAHAIAYDLARERLVLFGGLKRADFPLDDVWEFDGTTWTEIVPADGVHPPARSSHQLVYDEVSSRILLTGGNGAETWGLSDVWAWDGAQWTELAPDVELPSIEHASWDPASGELLALVDDTIQAFDGEQWQPSPWGALPYDPDAVQRLVASPLHDGVVVVTRERAPLNTDDDLTALISRQPNWSFEPVLGVVHTNHDYQFEVVPHPAEGQIYANLVGYGLSGGLWSLHPVDRPNRAPYLTPPADQRVDFDAQLVVALAAIDSDGDPLTFGAEPLPVGATIDPATGRFVWTPTATDGGIHTVEVWATDGRRASLATLTIEVSGPVAYPTLPEGEDLELTAVFEIPGTADSPYCVDLNCDRIEQYRDSEVLYRGACTLTGDNPGQVDVWCTVGGEYFGYGGQRWTLSGISATADLARDGTFVAVDPDRGELVGRVEALPWDDYQLVVDGFDFRDTQGHHTVGTGPVSAFLDR